MKRVASIFWIGCKWWVLCRSAHTYKTTNNMRCLCKQSKFIHDVLLSVMARRMCNIWYGSAPAIAYNVYRACMLTISIVIQWLNKQRGEYYPYYTGCILNVNLRSMNTFGHIKPGMCILDTNHVYTSMCMVKHGYPRCTLSVSVFHFFSPICTPVLAQWLSIAHRTWHMFLICLCSQSGHLLRSQLVRFNIE